MTGRLVAPRHDGIDVSKRSIFVALACMMWIWVVDPFGWGFEFRGETKAIPILLLALLIAFCFLHPSKTVLLESRSRRALVPMALFSTLGGAGALYARLVLGIQNTFITICLFPLFVPLLLYSMERLTCPRRAVRSGVRLLALCALLVAMYQALRVDIPLFHAREHFVIPFVVYWVQATRSRLAQCLYWLIFGAAAYAAHKNTSYLVYALCVLFSIFIFVECRILPRIGRLAAVPVHVTILCLLAFAAIGSASLIDPGRAPSGSREYREVTYARALDRFLSSPVYGNGFTNAAAETFGAFEVSTETQVLPTHSDLLDILANGGVVGACLWAASFLWILRIGWRRVRNSRIDRPASASLLALMISGVFVSAFNPILNITTFAGLYWTMVAWLLVLSGTRTQVR